MERQDTRQDRHVERPAGHALERRPAGAERLRVVAPAATGGTARPRRSCATSSRHSRSRSDALGATAAPAKNDVGSPIDDPARSRPSLKSWFTSAKQSGRRDVDVVRARAGSRRSSTGSPTQTKRLRMPSAARPQEVALQPQQVAARASGSAARSRSRRAPGSAGTPPRRSSASSPSGSPRRRSRRPPRSRASRPRPRACRRRTSAAAPSRRRSRKVPFASARARAVAGPSAAGGEIRLAAVADSTTDSSLRPRAVGEPRPPSLRCAPGPVPQQPPTTRHAFVQVRPSVVRQVRGCRGVDEPTADLRRAPRVRPRRPAAAAPAAGAHGAHHAGANCAGPSPQFTPMASHAEAAPGAAATCRRRRSPSSVRSSRVNVALTDDRDRRARLPGGRDAPAPSPAGPSGSRSINRSTPRLGERCRLLRVRGERVLGPDPAVGSQADAERADRTPPRTGLLRRVRPQRPRALSSVDARRPRPCRPAGTGCLRTCSSGRRRRRHGRTSGGSTRSAPDGPRSNARSTCRAPRLARSATCPCRRRPATAVRRRAFGVPPRPSRPV